MASTSSSSSSSSTYYSNPARISFLSPEEIVNMETYRRSKSLEKDEKDPDIREKIVKVVTSSMPMMAMCFPPSSRIPLTSIRRIPRATITSPVEILNGDPRPATRIVSAIAGGATPVIHDSAKLSTSPEFQSCYDNVQFINKFFLEVLSINPVQTASKTMKVEIQRKMYDKDGQEEFNNAFWVGNEEAVVVTRRSPEFSPFESNFSVIAHEFGHAMIHYSSNMSYEGQSGSLHEHAGDVIGIMAKHYRSRQLASGEDTDWRIAEGIILANPRSSIRSMSHPGTAIKGTLGDDRQPNHMSRYDKNNENPHLHCGIPNKAFYLASSRIGGGSWQKAGEIWTTALQEASQRETFEMFSNRTADITKRLYGEREYDVVRKSWFDVGVCTREWEMIKTSKQKIFHENRIMRNIQSWKDYDSLHPISNAFEIGFYNVCLNIKEYCRKRIFRDLELVYSPIRLNIDRLSPI